jgi:hypothetical protein
MGGLSSGEPVMRREQYRLKDAIESVPSVAPLIPSAASYKLGWMGLGLQAVRFRESNTNEVSAPAISQHALILVTRPPEEMNMRYEGVKRDIPPAAGSVAVMPAGSTSLWRWRGSKDSLHIYLEPRLIERVATTSFELDSARMVVPPLDAHCPRTSGGDVGRGCRINDWWDRRTTHDRVTGQRFGHSPDPSPRRAAPVGRPGGRRASAPEAPHGCRIHHGESRRQSDARGNGCSRPY